jgi:hypothetical protein
VFPWVETWGVWQSKYIKFLANYSISPAKFKVPYALDVYFSVLQAHVQEL